VLRFSSNHTLPLFLIANLLLFCVLLDHTSADTVRQLIPTDSIPLSDAQALAGMPISAISFSGKFRVHRFILQREIDSRVGDSLDLELLDRDRAKIFTLGIFSRVEPYLVPQHDSVMVDFRLKEVWTLLPLISIGQTDQNLDLAFGMEDKDFLGLYSHTAVLYRRFEGKNSVSLSTGFPRAFGEDLYLGLSLYDQRENDPLTFDGVTGEYDYQHKGVSGLIGRRLHEQVYASLYGGYDRETWSLRADSENQPRIALLDYPRYSFGGAVTLGRVYYDRYFYRGSDISTSMSLIKEYGEASFNKWRNNITGRIYRIFGRFNLAGRARLQISSADERAYPYSIAGDVNVRGYVDNIRRGDYLLSSNLELRMRAVESRLLYTQVTSFVDYGVIWGRNSDFSERFHDPYWALGVGVRGALKSFLANVGRVDLAFNPSDGNVAVYLSSHQFF